MSLTEKDHNCARGGGEEGRKGGRGGGEGVTSEVNFSQGTVSLAASNHFQAHHDCRKPLAAFSFEILENEPALR